MVSLIALLSCTQNTSAETEFARVNLSFIHGYLQQSQLDAAQDVERFRNSQPEWSRKFRVLEARIALWRGLYPDALKILESGGSPTNQADTHIAELSLRGVANAYIHNFSDAESLLGQAVNLCEIQTSPSCGELLQARGLLASQEKKSSLAASLYQEALRFAQAHHENFLESSALLNLGAEFLSQNHLDEAIDFSESSQRAAAAENARVVELAAQANIGWARYRLGDSEGALAIFLQAEKESRELGDISDQENELTDLGYIYMDQGRLSEAKQSFSEALNIARGITFKEDIYNALRVLARLSVELNDINRASEFAEQALDIAREISSHEDELYPRLVQGQIAAKRNDFATAEGIFRQIERDPQCPVFLKWEAEHSLAQVYRDQGSFDQADSEYRTALTTFERARSTVRHEDFQISFLANGAHLYDDYVHFLVSRDRNADALSWADMSRARSLAEGLGVATEDALQTSSNSPIAPPHPNLRAIARTINGTVLFYWLGENESYLWAVTPVTTQIFILPTREQLETQVLRYRKALIGPQNVLDSGNEDGLALYRTLVEPASRLIPPNSRVCIIPDGSLNNLNFETVIVPSAKPHFWIEDAEVVTSSSLRILAATPRGRTMGPKRLLLIGNSVAASQDYPELPKADDQMKSVSRQFPETGQRVFQRGQATPEAYLSSNPEQFSNIHFVAHGIGSRLSPLDSAIVLSKEDGNPNNFKLYARDIIHHHLRAELVTISACYGAGERQYYGEGLVGLAWAFLRAGSRNVVAALWDVEDVSTQQLMDRFYSELAKGSQPEAALRAAKLSLLKGGVFRNPFYWAPFQLYRG